MSRKTTRRIRSVNEVSVCIVLPSFNEGASAPAVLEKLAAEAWLLKQENADKRITITVLYVEDGPRANSEMSDVEREKLLKKQTLHGINAATRHRNLSGLDDVRCFWRNEHVDGQKWGDLAGAVVDGMRIARKLECQYVIVMDSDGQHPATLLRPMFNALQQGYQMVMPSRYIEGGDASGLSDAYRQKVSLHAKRVARRFFPRSLKAMSDPLGGCFGLCLSAIDVEVLANVHDWKIALEVLVLNTHLSYVEFPYKFEEREAGESKAKLSHGWGLLKQLLRLRWATWPEWFRFGIIGGVTSVFGVALLWALYHAGVPLRAAVWTELVVTLFANLWVYYYDLWPGLSKGQLALRVPPFLGVRFATMWLSAHLTVELTHAMGLHYQVANAVGLLAGMVINWPTTKAIFNFRRADMVPKPTWAERNLVLLANQSREVSVVDEKGWYLSHPEGD